MSQRTRQVLKIETLGPRAPLTDVVRAVASVDQPVFCEAAGKRIYATREAARFALERAVVRGDVAIEDQDQVPYECPHEGCGGWHLAHRMDRR